MDNETLPDTGEFSPEVNLSRYLQIFDSFRFCHLKKNML